MDELTNRIILHLRRDGRLSYTTLSELTGSPREAVAIRVNELLSSKKLRIVAGIHPHVVGLTVSAHVSLTVLGPMKPTLAKILAMDDLVFISQVSGSASLIVETRDRDVSALGRRLEALRALSGVSAAEVLIYDRISHNFFLGNEPLILPTLDDTDLALLAALQGNGRASYAQLAKWAGLSPTGCRSRVLRLVESGTIRIGAIKARQDMTDDLLFGIGISGADAAARLNAEPGLEFVARTIGRFDLVATVGFGSLRAFNTLIDDLRRLPGISRCETWLHSRILRERYELPLPLAPRK